MRRHLLPLLVLVVAAACGQPSTTPQEATGGAASTTMADATATPAALFATRAAMIETYQIQAAHIAQARGRSDAVKTYATAALAEHQAALQDITRAAQASGQPTPSGALDDDFSAYVDMLNHANSASFDTTYAAQQAIIFTSASGLYDSFTTTAPDSPLKQLAQARSPRVHAGVNAARDLAAAAQSAGN